MAGNVWNRRWNTSDPFAVTWRCGYQTTHCAGISWDRDEFTSHSQFHREIRPGPPRDREEIRTRNKMIMDSVNWRWHSTGCSFPRWNWTKYKKWSFLRVVKSFIWLRVDNARRSWYDILPAVLSFNAPSGNTDLSYFTCPLKGTNRKSTLQWSMNYFTNYMT